MPHLPRETMTALRSKTLSFRAIPNKRQVLSAVSLAGLVGLPGCSAVTGNPVVSLIRIVDASSNSNGIDVYQGSGALAYNLGLGTITTYVPVTPGTYNINVDAAGGKTQLATVLGSFGPNAQYTVVVGDNSTVLGETVLKDQSVPAPSGQVALRFIHQSSAGGAVDIYLIPNGSTISQVKPILTGVTFGTNTGYLNEPAGTYTLAAVPTGTVPSATTATSYSGNAVVYGSGTAKTIVLINQPLLTTPGIQVVMADDFDPATATS
ncbi:DUF4397 domain-containing protein [Granulicella tundricola]|nr:DUF4397 domain-containing protein [Granulicella tundricola]